MSTPSPKRQLILDFITSFIQQKGYAPSLREVTAGCDISSISVTSYNLAILEREGRLRRSRDVSRSIVLACKGKDVPPKSTICYRARRGDGFGAPSEQWLSPFPGSRGCSRLEAPAVEGRKG